LEATVGRVHVIVGTSEDRDYLEEALAESPVIAWPTPKSAEAGDTVLFLIPYMTGEIWAVGEVQKPTGKSKDWAPKYEAEIENVQRLRKPIPITRLQAHFPEWKYLSYARNYTTVPADYCAELLRIIRAGS
jgi:hypothetical protein